MALFGFMDGFNEQREVEQKLESEAQLSKFRAIEAGMGLQKIQKQAAVESILAKVFAGAEPGEVAGGDPEIALANKMTKATPLLMAVDPAIGLHFATGASEIKRRKSMAEKERLDAQAEAEEQRGGILASIDSQENYGPGMEQYVAAGGKPPPNLTGDWEQDRPVIQRMANATMKAKDQAIINARELAADAKADRDRRIAASEFEKLGQATERLRLQREENARKKLEDDKEASARQSNIRRLSVANDRDVDKAYKELLARSDKPNLAKEQLAVIAARAATKAKSRLVSEGQEGADYLDLVNEELDSLLDPKSGVVDPGEKSSWFDPFGLVTGRKGSLKAGKEPVRAAESAAPVEDQKGKTRPIHGVDNIELAARTAWGSYEPNKYDYRMLNGKPQRSPK